MHPRTANSRYTKHPKCCFAYRTTNLPLPKPKFTYYNYSRWRFDSCYGQLVWYAEFLCTKQLKCPSNDIILSRTPETRITDI